MRTIVKQGNGGFHLNQAHANPPKNHQQATTKWRNFGHKPALLQALLDEQFNLCCYSEIRVDEEALGHHVEHVENKRQNPARTFDYTNLAASALNSYKDLPAFKAQGHETFGGHAPGKQKGCNMNQFVTCHQAGGSNFFAYLSDGRVVPRIEMNAGDTERAQYTIDILNLNSPFLITRRRQWWQELDVLFEEHILNSWSLGDLASIDLIPSGKKVSKFFSLTRQFFGQIAEQTLQEYAPALV